MHLCFHKIFRQFHVIKYSSNKIRKTENDHLIIICQNLIVCIPNFKANFLIFGCLYHLVFDLETMMANIWERAISILAGNYLERTEQFQPPWFENTWLLYNLVWIQLVWPGCSRIKSGRREVFLMPSLCVFSKIQLLTLLKIL